MSKYKFSVIPPILSNGSFITSSLEKAKIFNTLFANQCTTVDTDSTLPNPPSTDPQFKIENITLNESKVKLILKLLNPNKSQGWDNVSIRMIKMCGPDLAKPLVIIYKNCLAKGVFPSIWKKANVLPIHKKDIKHNAKNYRPISLLPIFGKILEKIIFDDLYAHFFENNIISEHQSGFRKGNYCQFATISTKPLTKTHRLRQEESFLIYPKHLIKSGMQVFYSSYTSTVCQASYIQLSQVSLSTGIKELPLRELSLRGIL